MARGALQEGIAFVLEREPGTQLMRSIIRQVLGDRDEDGAVELRAGHLTVRDRDALRVLAAGATQLAETYRDPSTRLGPKLDAALVELVGRLVPVIEDRLGPDSVRTWFDEENGRGGGTLDLVIAPLQPFLPGLEQLSARALQSRVERALAAFEALAASRTR
jgi:hypothetical protein